METENLNEFVELVKQVSNEIVTGFILLRDAKQSTEMTAYTCSPNKCPASNAIDGDILTDSVTNVVNDREWWSAKLDQTSVINKILVYASKYGFRNGKYNKFSVDTGMSRKGMDTEWRVCKGEYKMEEPHQPHVVECDSTTIAEFIRLSVRGSNLYLNEVKVTGTVSIGELYLPYHIFYPSTRFFIRK